MANAICQHCHEPIQEGDPVMPFNNGEVLMHRNCGLRGVLGSVAHIQKRCSCFVQDSTEGDDPKLTPRQAADAAVAAWKRAEAFSQAARCDFVIGEL